MAYIVKPIITPTVRILLFLTNGELLAYLTEYQSVVGALNYLIMTRPNIAYGVQAVSQFMHASRTTHRHTIKCIFRYLRGNQAHGLLLCSSASPCMT